MSKKKSGFLKSRLSQLGQTKDFVSAIFKDTSKIAGDGKKEYKGWVSQAREKIKNPANANFELGKKFYHETQLSDASMRFKLALLMNNELKDANFWLGKTYLAKGDYPTANKYFKIFAENSEKTKHLSYFLALTAEDTKIPFPDHELIKEYFSLFSNFFNESFTRSFNYQGISATYERIDAKYTDHNKELNILEIGCGTGLLATKIKANYKNVHITGVDFCPEMIDLCKKQKINKELIKDHDIIDLTQEISSEDVHVYDKLVKKDFFEHIKNEDTNYDLVICRGFLHYCSNLKGFFKESAKLLNKNGSLIFHVNKPYNKEQKQELFKKNSYPFYLEIRSHTKTSIEKSGKDAGLAMDYAEAIEIEQNIKSNLYLFEKK